MREKMMSVALIIAAIFFFWLLMGVLKAFNVPFWTINLPLTGFLVALFVFKCISDDED